MRALVERDDKLADTVGSGGYARSTSSRSRSTRWSSPTSPRTGRSRRERRLVLTASKISSNLERIADEATKIARRARELNTEPLLKPLDRHPAHGRHRAGDAARQHHGLRRERPDLAVEIIAPRPDGGQHQQAARPRADRYMVDDPKTITRALNLMTVAKAIERVADHATNIAEEVFYLYHGAGHPPRSESEREGVARLRAVAERAFDIPFRRSVEVSSPMRTFLSLLLVSLIACATTRVPPSRSSSSRPSPPARKGGIHAFSSIRRPARSSRCIGTDGIQNAVLPRRVPDRHFLYAIHVKKSGKAEEYSRRVRDRRPHRGS